MTLWRPWRGVGGGLGAADARAERRKRIAVVAFILAVTGKLNRRAKWKLDAWFSLEDSLWEKRKDAESWNTEGLPASYLYVEEASSKSDFVLLSSCRVLTCVASRLGLTLQLQFAGGAGYTALTWNAILLQK